MQWRQRNVQKSVMHVQNCCFVNALFSYVGKIPDERGFYFLPTIPDLPIYRIIARSLSQILERRHVICDSGTGTQQFRGFLNERNLSPTCPTVQMWVFICREWSPTISRPSLKSETRRENRNAPDSPDLSPTIPDDGGYLRFRVFIIRQNLRQSGNSQIPDRLGFSRHMKTRLN